jgi:ligand-binding sensor domain-containing protein/signal transduction histidine kinase
MLRVLSVFFLSISGFAWTIFAQTPVTKFNHLTIKDGLSQSTIEAIVKDDIGYMWFGTNDGLNRYDGYEMTVYYHDPEDPHSISDSYIYHIIKDRHGDLWIGTNNGLNRFDMHTEKFERFLHIPGNPNSISNNFVHRIVEDQKGNLWIATVGGGLNFYDRNRARFQKFVNDPNDPNSLSDDRLIALAIDNHNYLWIGSYAGKIDRFSLDTFYDHYAPNENEINSPLPSGIAFEHVRKMDSDGEDIIWNIYTFESNQIFVCTNRNGLLKYSSGKQKITKEKFGWEGARSVHALLKDRAGRFWIATESDGVQLYDPMEKTTKSFTSKINEPWGINDNGIWSLYEDEVGRIWIGTEFGGVNIYDPFRHKFRHYMIQEDNPKMDSQAIWAISETADGILWLGTDGRGLISYDRNKNVYRHFLNNPSDQNSLSYNFVSSLLPAKEGAIWIGTNGGGLNYYNYKNDRFKRYLNQNDNKNSLANNIIKALCQDNDDQIWIGTYGSGLDRFDPQTNRFKNYPVGIEFISVLHHSAKGELWIGSYGEGLGRYNPKTDKISIYKNGGNDISGISSDRIYSIFEYDNTIWIGTANGLNRYHPGSDSFRHFTVKDGLANNVIYAILKDDQQNLWLSTNRGISKFDPGTKQFTNFDPSDGLQDYEFNRNAALAGRDGLLYFGGINGFNAFTPEEIQVNGFEPQIVFTDFLKWNRSVQSDSALHTIQSIHLNYNEMSFGFKFAALDYTDPAKNQYKYILAGFEYEWVNAGSRRFATYTQLGPGEYHFRVQAANSDGIWNEQGISVAVVVSPPFWQTWWFYLLTALSVVLIIIMIFRIRLRIRIQRAVEIERIKTSENEHIRTKAAQDFHDGLGHKLAKISMMSQTLKSIFGQTETKNLEYLDKIAETSESLNNDMRNFLWLLDPGKDSLFEIAIKLKDFGEELYDKSGIAFKVREIPRALESISLNMEFKRHFMFLFREAMSNALKHAAAMNVELSFEINHNTFVVRLKDDGCGFAGSTSMGHGISNMKQRADKICAHLKIESQKGLGTSLTLTAELPKLVGESAP